MFEEGMIGISLAIILVFSSILVANLPIFRYLIPLDNKKDGNTLPFNLQNVGTLI